MKLFIKHPRSGERDTMLSFSLWALIACLFKFLTNGVEFTILDITIKLGTVDAALVAALLTPTLVAYTMRKWKSPPPTKAKNKED